LKQHTLFQSFGNIPQNQFLLGVTAFALAVRVALILFISHPAQIIADPAHTLLYEHGNIAHNLYAGHGFSMQWPYASLDSARLISMKAPPKWEGAFLPPLNPLLLFLTYEIFGETSTALYAIMIFYAIISAFIPLAVYKLARLIGDERSARISAIVAALFLPSAYAVVTFSGSALYQLLAIIILYYSVRCAQRPSWQSFIMLGLLCGVMTQLRSEFFFLGALLIATVVVATRLRHSLPLRQGLAAFLVFIAVVTPWTVRNYSLFHRFVPVLSHPWFEMWRGNNVMANGTTRNEEGNSIWISAASFPNLVHQMDSIPYDQTFEVNVDQIFKREVFHFIANDPIRFVSLGARKIFYLFTFDPYQPTSRSPFYIIPMLGVSILTIAGFYRLTRDRSNRPALLIFGVFLAAYLGMTVMTVMLARYQIYVFTALLGVTGLAFRNKPRSLAE
jgi:4-amino-4-deoxy-L-arabinose transferase-like glycosyltransferase